MQKSVLSVLELPLASFQHISFPFTSLSLTFIHSKLPPAYNFRDAVLLQYQAVELPLENTGMFHGVQFNHVWNMKS